ncbi:MAG: hypothetical protein K6F27_04500 [Ruminococcus sp.]|nr:hypothetical protein [Ruminococcus sp.]
MGRRKNNPQLVQELIDGRWTMDQTEFEEKYLSLSDSDMTKVSMAIDGMEDEMLSNYDDDCNPDGLSVYEAAEIWASNGKDEDYTFGYSEYELEKAPK